MKLEVLDDSATPEEINLIRRGLGRFNREVGGLTNFKELVVLLKDEDGSVVGGLVGHTLGTWLHIETLWVHESERSKGHGQAVLEAAEREAVKRGCVVAELTTFGFQAPEFYKKKGYAVFGQLKEVGGNHIAFYMSKRLGTHAADA